MSQCPDCKMTFKETKLLQKHRQRFCPGHISSEQPLIHIRKQQCDHSNDSSLREDMLRLEMRVVEAISKVKESSEENNFWKQRQKQAENIDQNHAVHMVEIRERDHRLGNERARLQGEMNSLGVLAMIALRPHTPPPRPPPPVPPPTIIPPSQPIIIPPNPPPVPQAPIIIEPPPPQPVQVITIESGSKGTAYPPLPPPPPIIMPPSHSGPSGNSLDHSSLLLMQQMRDNDATHQSNMRELQDMLRQIEQNSRKRTPPPIIIPSPQPPIILPRPEPPIIINPPVVNRPPNVYAWPVAAVEPPPPPRPVAATPINDSLFVPVRVEREAMTIFWDFIIGLPSEATAVRLYSALYNASNAVGKPTSLPVFKTQQPPPISASDTKMVMISRMQEIPGCEPSSDLGVIVELHLSTANGPLESKAWVKVDVLDEKLCVKSGRWRVPLRQVPVDTSINTTAVRKLPQFHKGELFFRLVKQSQAQDEAKQKMNPNYANYYTSL